MKLFGNFLHTISLLYSKKGLLPILFTLLLILVIPLTIQILNKQTDDRSRAAPGNYQKIASYTGIGSTFDSIVGPGPTPSSERLYIPYSYSSGSFELVAVDPATNAFTVYKSPLIGEEAARALTKGIDGKIYIGGGYLGHLYVFDPLTSRFTDLGKANSSEDYIFSADVDTTTGNIYLGTYPNGKLIRYSPQTNQFTDLGVVENGQKYAKYVVYGKDGYIYIGVGGSLMNIYSYRISDGSKTPLLSSTQRNSAFSFVYMGNDSKIYGYAEWNPPYYLLSGTTASPVTNNAPQKSKKILSNGRIIQNVGRGSYEILTPSTGQVSYQTFAYLGSPLHIQRLGLGPNNLIYGGSLLPAEMFSIDPSNANVLTKLGLIDLENGGEIYSYLSANSKLYMAGYYSIDYGFYDPTQPFIPGVNPIKNGTLPQDYRPEAIIQASNGKMYIGATASYGSLRGYLVVTDPNNISQAATYQPFSNLSITSLVQASDTILVGGTGVVGGNGSSPTATSVKLFTWDTTSNSITNSYDFAKGYKVTSLIKDPKGGTIYGIVYDPTNGSQVFTYDPSQHKILRVSPFPASPIYNSMAFGVDSNIWGLSSGGVFTIDPLTLAVTLDPSPVEITGGFALLYNSIYFTHNSDIYQYTIPFTPSNSPTPTPASTNLLQNPGFESGMTGWNHEGTAVLTQTNTHSETQAIKLGGSMTTDGYTGQVIPVTPGASYIAEGWFREDIAGSNDSLFGVVFYDSNNVKLTEVTTKVTETTYTLKSLPFTPPINAVNAQIGIYKFQGSNFVFADDLSVTKNSTITTPSPTSLPTPTPTPTIVPTTTSIDSIKPAVSITSPLNGSTLPRKSNVTITATASDTSGIAKVEFYVNGSLRCIDTTASYSCVFKTAASHNASYTLTATAYDNFNNVATFTLNVKTN